MEEIQKFYAEDWNESQRLVSQSGQIFMDIHLSLCDKKSNLGYSEHGLIVAQK